MHYRLRRCIAGPLKNLSLQVAADVDLAEGELPKSDSDEGPSALAIEKQLYGQPCLKASIEERGPMPYRRSEGDEEAIDSNATPGAVEGAEPFRTTSMDAESESSPTNMTTAMSPSSEEGMEVTL